MHSINHHDIMYTCDSDVKLQIGHIACHIITLHFIPLNLNTYCIYIYSCLCLGFDVLHRTQLAPVFQVPNSGVFAGHWPSPRDPKVQGSWKAPKMRTPPSAGNEKNDTPQLFGYRNPKPKDCSVWGFFKLGILDKSLQKLKFKWQLE